MQPYFQVGWSVFVDSGVHVQSNEGKNHGNTTKIKVMFLLVPGKPYQELTISRIAKASDTFRRFLLNDWECSKNMTLKV